MSRFKVSACVFSLVALALLALQFPARTLRTPRVLAASVPTACVFPNAPIQNADQLAWQLFVAANCPTGKAAAPLVWETWPTQEQVFRLSSSGNADAFEMLGVKMTGSSERFHPSVQAQAIHAATTKPTGGLQLAPSTCNAPTTATNPYNGANRKRVLCEEVRMNPAAAAYVSQNSLYTAAGQSAFLKGGKAFQFPYNAMEVKADWEQNCPAGAPSLHTETINGTPYCLVAMHIDSKLLPDWLWATFETRNGTENPARCYSIGCKDTYGFSPAVIPSGYGSLAARNSQTMTAALTALESSANLEPAMRSYTMDASQTQFVDAQGRPTLLGNSVTEAELAGVPLNAASCITCHSTSVVNTASQQNLGPLQMNMVGRPPQTPGYASRDFVWTFIIAQGYKSIP